MAGLPEPRTSIRLRGHNRFRARLRRCNRFGLLLRRIRLGQDIEATIQEITRGRVAAISVPVNGTEQLVTVIELKERGDSNEEAMHWLTSVKSDVTSAISNAHGLNVGDLVLVAPGSIPTTTSGKIRRAACVEQYRQDQFVRLAA